MVEGCTVVVVTKSWKTMNCHKDVVAAVVDGEGDVDVVAVVPYCYYPW